MQSLPVIVCYLNNNNKVQLTCSVKEKQAPHDPSPRLVSRDFLYKFAMKVAFPINKMEVVHVLKVQQIILGRKKIFNTYFLNITIFQCICGVSLRAIQTFL